MPNWKLSPGVRQAMRDAAVNLCGRRIMVAQSGFPLTEEEAHELIIGREVMEQLNVLKGMKVNTISKANSLVADIKADRTVSIQINFNEQVEYKNSNQHYYSRGEARELSDISYLPPLKQVQLLQWTNNLLREYRMADITKKTVLWFLEGNWSAVQHMTAAHIMANWPALTLLVDDNRVLPEWRNRFHQVPSKLDRWSLRGYPEYIKHKSAMKLAEMFLNSAVLLPSDQPKEPLNVLLVKWVRQPGDPD
jgi:hypothetical protein